MRKKAIFISAIDFESPVQIGDHQLARQFAQDGWEIAFLSTPITPFHLLGRHREIIRRRFQTYRQGGVRHKLGAGEIWSYVPAALVIPKNNRLLNRPWVYHHWIRWTVPNIAAALKKQGFAAVDLLYIRDPLQALYLELVDARQIVYRIADQEAGFRHYNAHVQQLERSLAQRADVVLYTAPNLAEYAARLNPKRTFFLPNGVDNAHFNRPQTQIPPEIQTLRRPIVIYVGSIDYWFDFDLFNRLSGALADFSFVVIGSAGRYAERFVRRENVHLLGPKAYAELPAYLHHADVGIIPFNVQQFPDLVHAINPLKLYEYLASGLPVVATDWQALRTIQSPARLCSTGDEFIAAVRSAAASNEDPDVYRCFARAHDWSQRYQELKDLLARLA